jgi:hypothetical protein
LGEAWGGFPYPVGVAARRAIRQFSTSWARAADGTIWSMLPPLENLQHTVALAGAALLALLLTLPM